MEKEVLQKLQDHPWFRERSARAKGFAILLNRKHNFGFDKAKLADFADALIEVETMARYWRRHLEDYPGLRGRDYDHKTKLVQQRQKKLGYEPVPLALVHKVQDKVAMENT